MCSVKCVMGYEEPVVRNENKTFFVILTNVRIRSQLSSRCSPWFDRAHHSQLTTHNYFGKAKNPPTTLNTLSYPFSMRKLDAAMLRLPLRQ